MCAVLAAGKLLRYDRPVPYQSVDQLQRTLTTEVFHYAKDAKKAAGRALGTLVEIITYYLLHSWKLGAHVAIERGLAEYGNPAITHNVEYSLHPVAKCSTLEMPKAKLPLTSAKILAAIKTQFPDARESGAHQEKKQALLTTRGLVRNACVVGEDKVGSLVATEVQESGGSYRIKLAEQMRAPFAMFECKRVGIEEGMKKGPQTIEKAKQGAYVARAVSSLHKVRGKNGALLGVLPRADGSLECKPHDAFLAEIVASDSADWLRDFILSVGVVSNHGNWFTAQNQNKEMMVLAQSYDWLLFLTDSGLAQFIEEVLLKPRRELTPARVAFLASYPKTCGENRFTKVRIDLRAHEALIDYFASETATIESWFNVIAPAVGSIRQLRNQLETLTRKDWASIHAK
jgi:hypothetical protein